MKPVISRIIFTKISLVFLCSAWCWSMPMEEVENGNTQLSVRSQGQAASNDDKASSNQSSTNSSVRVPIIDSSNLTYEEFEIRRTVGQGILDYYLMIYDGQKRLKANIERDYLLSLKKINLNKIINFLNTEYVTVSDLVKKLSPHNTGKKKEEECKKAAFDFYEKIIAGRASQIARHWQLYVERGKVNVGISSVAVSSSSVSSSTSWLEVKEEEKKQHVPPSSTSSSSMSSASLSSTSYSSTLPVSNKKGQERVLQSRREEHLPNILYSTEETTEEKHAKRKQSKRDQKAAKRMRKNRWRRLW